MVVLYLLCLLFFLTGHLSDLRDESLSVLVAAVRAAATRCKIVLTKDNKIYFNVTFLLLLCYCAITYFMTVMYIMHNLTLQYSIPVVCI